MVAGWWDDGVRLGEGPALVIDFRYHIVSLVAVFLALAARRRCSAPPSSAASSPTTCAAQVRQLDADKRELQAAAADGRRAAPGATTR